MWEFCVCLLVCVHFSFAIILKRKRKLVVLLLLSYRCIITINVLWLFLVVPWVGLQCVIVVFPDHTHFLNKFNTDNNKCVLFRHCPTFFIIICCSGNYVSHQILYVLGCQSITTRSRYGASPLVAISTF